MCEESELFNRDIMTAKIVAITVTRSTQVNATHTITF